MIAAVLLALVTFLQPIPVPASTPESLLADVRRLESAASNDARFEALTAMLRARDIAFTVEAFTIEKPVGTEPRVEGRNIVVSLGEGAGEPADHRQRARGDGPREMGHGPGDVGDGPGARGDVQGAVGEIVIGAHYDAARLADGTLSGGAVDNAASCVVLVRLAEALRAEPVSRRIRIVWFDMEELGLIGSRRYVEAHASDRIAAMLNFDINAYGDTIVYGPSEREDSAWLRRAALEACGREDFACIAFPQLPPGDDRSFLARGIPALSFGTLPAIEAHQLWLMLNAGSATGLAAGTTPAIVRTIHTADDTSARVDGKSMARALRFALSLVRGLDGR